MKRLRLQLLSQLLTRPLVYHAGAYTMSRTLNFDILTLTNYKVIIKIIHCTQQKYEIYQILQFEGEIGVVASGYTSR